MTLDALCAVAPAPAVRVIVCGGRDYANKARLFSVLDRLHSERRIDHIITGAARGADSLALQWASINGVRFTGHPADWKRHGAAAGPRRNQAMLDFERPTAVLAFPGGRGTADMVRRARAAQVPVWMIDA